MLFYQKQMILISLLLIFFIFLGLVIVAINMERITLREGQDFLFCAAQEEGGWELRFLGTSLEINKEAVREQLRSVGSQIAPYVARGRASIEKIKAYLQEQLGQGKNRQGGGHPIK